MRLPSALLPCCILLLLPSFNLVLAANETTTSTASSSCSRRIKRSLTFPKGSAFVLTITLLKPIQVRVPSNWNLDMEFDMIWPIPAGVDALRAPHRRPWTRRQPHRRHRRQLYANFELALDSQGLPGKECILRSICEARFILNPVGVSLVEDLLRVVFRVVYEFGSYPSAAATSRSVNDVYDNASVTRTDCDIAYPCPFSLLDMLLNYQNDVSTDK